MTSRVITARSPAAAPAAGAQETLILQHAIFGLDGFESHIGGDQRARQVGRERSDGAHLLHGEGDDPVEAGTREQELVLEGCGDREARLTFEIGRARSCRNPRTQQSQFWPLSIELQSAKWKAGASSQMAMRVSVSATGVWRTSVIGPQGLGAMSSKGVSAWPATAQPRP